MSDKVLEVDIHGMSVIEGKSYLQHVLKSCSPSICEIVVIHGNNSGTNLANMVRNDLKSKKIKRKLLSMNRGITTLVLN